MEEYILKDLKNISINPNAKISDVLKTINKKNRLLNCFNFGITL